MAKKPPGSATKEANKPGYRNKNPKQHKPATKHLKDVAGPPKGEPIYPPYYAEPPLRKPRRNRPSRAPGDKGPINV